MLLKGASPKGEKIHPHSTPSVNPPNYKIKLGIKMFSKQSLNFVDLFTKAIFLIMIHDALSPLFLKDFYRD